MKTAFFIITIYFSLYTFSTAQDSALPAGDFDVISIPVGGSANPLNANFANSSVNEMGLSVNPVTALNGTLYPLGEVTASDDRLDIRLRANEAVLILSAPIPVSSTEVYFSCLAQSQGSPLQQSALALIDNQDFNNLGVTLSLNQDIPRDRSEYSIEFSPNTSEVILLIQLLGPSSGEASITLERLRVMDGYTDMDYSLGATHLTVIEHFGSGIDHIIQDIPPSQGGVSAGLTDQNRTAFPNAAPQSLLLSTTNDTDVIEVSIPFNKQSIQPLATDEYLRVYAKAHIRRLSGTEGVLTTALFSGVSGSGGYTQISIDSVPVNNWLEIETPVRFLNESTNALILITQIRGGSNVQIAVDDVSLHVRRESPYFWDSGIRSIPTDTPSPVPPTFTHTPMPPTATATPLPPSSTPTQGPTLPPVPLESVPAGFFKRGSNLVSEGGEVPVENLDLYDELPQRDIFISEFKADKYEVSNEFYNRFWIELSGEEKERRRPGLNAYGEDFETAVINRPKHPVVSVDWHDATAFCEWRTRRENPANDMRYRLPTEAEWEKMTRGTAVPAIKYPWGSTRPDQGAGAPHANYNSPIVNNRQVDGYEFTAPVDAFAAGASPFQVFNLAGNVWEWCLDLYDPDYYKSSNSPDRDPMGPTSNSSGLRVIRGGSWSNSEEDMRAAHRVFADVPVSRAIGFRCVLSGVHPTPTATPTATITNTFTPTATFTPEPPPSPTPRPYNVGITYQSKVLNIDMMYVPEGRYVRGNNAGGDFGVARPEESPQQTITISEFLIDKYEVTVELYRRFVQETNYTERGSLDEQTLSNPSSNPIVDVSYDDALTFISWRNIKEGFSAANGYRLPTEAEWEYAASYNTDNVYPWGNESPLLSPRANLLIANDGVENLAPVTDFQSGVSPLGIFNMAGNAAEWCLDWYAADYYTQSPDVNPMGPATGTQRVVRGGSWVDAASRARNAARNFRAPNQPNTQIGFRCVRPIR